MRWPLVQCLIMTLLASVVLPGCTGRTPARWERESIRVPSPALAYLADDGALLLGIVVERTLQPEHSGWHWVRVEPAFADQLFAATMPPPSSDWSTTLRTYRWADWEGDDANAQMIPPLTEPGLTSDTPPAELGTDLTPLTIVRNPRWGHSHFEVPGQPGMITANRLGITPSDARYQSERGRNRMELDRAIAKPFKYAVAIATIPSWVIPPCYVLWHYSVAEMLHEED